METVLSVILHIMAITTIAIWIYFLWKRETFTAEWIVLPVLSLKDFGILMTCIALTLLFLIFSAAEPSAAVILILQI